MKFQKILQPINQNGQWTTVDFSTDMCMPHNGFFNGFQIMKFRFISSRYVWLKIAQWVSQLNINVITVEYHHNAVQFITILHMTLWRQQQNIYQTSNSQQTPRTSPSQASYGVSIVRIFKKIDCYITAPNCISLWNLKRFSVTGIIVTWKPSSIGGCKIQFIYHWMDIIGPLITGHLSLTRFKWDLDMDK